MVLLDYTRYTDCSIREYFVLTISISPVCVQLEKRVMTMNNMNEKITMSSRTSSVMLHTYTVELLYNLNHKVDYHTYIYIM